MLTSHINQLTTRFGDEQYKLTTGYKGKHYSDLGTTNVTALTLNSEMKRVEGFIALFQTKSSEFQIKDNILSYMSNIKDDFNQNTIENLVNDFTTQKQNAENQFNVMVELLNSKIGNNFIFSGKKTDTPPVINTDIILNGDPQTGVAGFKTVMQEFIQANVGPSATQINSIAGRLTLADNAAGTISLSEDSGVAHQYGLKILSVDNGLPTYITTTQQNEFDTPLVSVVSTTQDATHVDGIGSAKCRK